MFFSLSFGRILAFSNITWSDHPQKIQDPECFLLCFILFHDNFLIADSWTSQNCLSYLVFDRIFSCHMIIISVLYIFQLSLHKTAVNFSTNGLHLDCIDDETPQFRMCTPPWIRPGSVLRQVPNFGFVLVSVWFTLSFFCVFVFKRVFISDLGPKRRWIHSLNLHKSSLFGWSLVPGGRNFAFHTAFLPPEHTNGCFLQSCPHCPVTQATMLSDV